MWYGVWPVSLIHFGKVAHKAEEVLAPIQTHIPACLVEAPPLFLLQGYACRARANQLKAQAFLDKEDMEMACESYAKCINDHIQCFELSKEHAQLCHAVIMAVNQGNKQHHHYV